MAEESKEVAPVFGGKVNVADMKNLAAKAQAAAQNNPRGGAPDGSDYLNFSGKRGVYTIGMDKRKIESDEPWVVDITSFEEGWVCWKGGQPASSRMANIYNGVPIEQPDPEELGPFDRQKGDGWFQAKGMVLKSLDEDQQGYFKINSVSGVSAMAELIGQFSERASAGEPCWPVLTLDVEEFEAQGFKNFKPVFNVLGWLDTDQVQTLDEYEGDIEDLFESAGDTPKVEAKTAVAVRLANQPPTRGVGDGFSLLLSVPLERGWLLGVPRKWKPKVDSVDPNKGRGVARN